MHFAFHAKAACRLLDPILPLGAILASGVKRRRNNQKIEQFCISIGSPSHIQIHSQGIGLKSTLFATEHLNQKHFNVVLNI